MRDSAYSNEAVLFFEQGEISKEMTYSEFEAVLDGVVGLDDFAGEDLDAAFVVVSGQLKITAAVLFRIRFDRHGNADRAWNLPLRHLADNGGAGPDLGAGAIRLSCRSQCSVSWHAPALWDPDMSAKSNTFTRLRDTIAANRLCLPVNSAPVPAPIPVIKPSTNWGVPPSQSQNYPAQNWPLGDPGSSSINAGWDGDDDGLSEAQLSALESEHRNKIAALIKQQRLHIHTLQNEAQQKLQSRKLAYDKELQLAKVEIARLKSEHESLHSQNMALREQNEAQRKQIDVLNRSREIEKHAAQQNGEAEMEQLRLQYEEQMLQRVQEETAKLKEDIELRNMELMYRHDVAKQLREELTQLRREKIRLVQEGGDKFLDRLEDLGISFIAFHPGAGHISITLTEMPAYMENPVAFAADKCLVSEEHYRIWLDHYQKPRCTAPMPDESVCGCRIPRVDVPNQFVSGESDRCDKHSGRKFGDNVVNLHP